MKCATCTGQAQQATKLTPVTFLAPVPQVWGVFFLLALPAALLTQVWLGGLGNAKAGRARQGCKLLRNRRRHWTKENSK